MHRESTLRWDPRHASTGTACRWFDLRVVAPLQLLGHLRLRSLLLGLPHGVGIVRVLLLLQALLVLRLLLFPVLLALCNHFVMLGLPRGQSVCTALTRGHERRGRGRILEGVLLRLIGRARIILLLLHLLALLLPLLDHLLVLSLAHRHPVGSVGVGWLRRLGVVLLGGHGLGLLIGMLERLLQLVRVL